MAERREFSLSVWLMPEGETYKRLAAVTDALSEKYKSPIIRPHATLAGGFTGDIEALTYEAERLAKELKPFHVRFSYIDQLNEFFRSLFIRVEKTPELLAAYETACRTFQRFDPKWSSASAENWLPHLSLIYGDFSPATKEIIRTSIADYPKSFEATKIHFVCNNERQLMWPTLAEFKIE